MTGHFLFFFNDRGRLMVEVPDDPDWQRLEDDYNAFKAELQGLDLPVLTDVVLPGKR